MTRLLRIVFLAVGGLLGLLVITGSAGYLWLRSSLPQIDGTVAVAGLTAPVEIMRDRSGVPHIFAETTDDAAFALGYVHAQDRLWQMEAMRRLGAGRLSEIFGRRTLQIDRYVRTFGFYRLAEAQAAALQGDQRAALEAYTTGVNAFLNGHAGALPPEFVLLGHRPEPWQPADSLVWSRIMAMRLSRNWRTELLRLRLSRDLTPDQIEELWPEDGSDAPLTLPKAMRAAALPLERLWRSLPSALAPVEASNAWVLDGNRSASGRPILANDPHLAFSAPILWYLAHIKTAELSLTGATVPGVPLLILGHNDHIAWGMTTTGGDVEDLYLERTDPSDPARYLTPEGARPFGTRIETIRIKGEDAITHRVRSTRHGPVISDIVKSAQSAIGDSDVIALASPALRRDDETARALYLINRARRWSEFVAATRHFHSPQQNIFYADVNGDIGMIAPGRVPLRRAGDGRVPVPGETAEYDWRGFVAFDALPRSHNPRSGVIVNANNALVGKDYPHLITRDWDKGYRAARITQVLGPRNGLTLADTAALQMDTVSASAQRLMPLLSAAQPETARAEAALSLLRRWDFAMRRDRPEPLIYSAWRSQLMRRIAADELGAMFDSYYRPRPRTDFVVSVLTDKPHWCDDIKTARVETCPEQLSRALDQAIADLTDRYGPDIAAWRWGAVHHAVFTHRVFTHVPLLKWMADRTLETDGNDDTVNRGQTSALDGNPFAHTHGAGYRAVYDLSDLDQSRFIIATGQSGNPLSPHYDDQLTRWRNGGFLRLAGDRAAVRRAAAGILTLKPAAR